MAEQAGKLFDLEQQEKNALTTKERAKKADEEVNNLLAQRAALMEQIAIAAKEGDFETQTKLKGRLARSTSSSSDTETRRSVGSGRRNGS